MLTLSAAFLVHRFLIDAVIVVIVAVVVYVVLEFVVRRADLAQRVAGLIVVLGLLALIDAIT